MIENIWEVEIMAAYQVENQWGGATAPWNTGGTWILGTRENQYLVGINITSSDGGRTFNGTVTYNGEGPITLKAKHKIANMYKVKVQWGGDAAPWNDEGTWIIGGRNVQRCVQLTATASGDGRILTGTMTYYGEGPIGFRGTYISSYHVENKWDTCYSDPWHNAGIWVLSGRLNQNVVAMDIKSSDRCGNVLAGTMTYANEGPIGFKAVRIVGNNYEVYNQWGGENQPWHRSGDMIIGASAFERVIQLKFDSKRDGEYLRGSVTYEGEDSIGFRAHLVQQIK